ncbi:hypothetical protein [Nocardia rhamnosiphila]
MSVNIELPLTIRKMKDERERAGITALLTEMLESRGSTHAVFITLGENASGLFVRAASEYPVISSGYRWLDDFEADLTRRAIALVPHAQVDFDWVDADGEVDDFDDLGEELDAARLDSLPAEVPVVHRNPRMAVGARELPRLTRNLLNYRPAGLTAGTLVAVIIGSSIGGWRVRARRQRAGSGRGPRRRIR